MARKYSIDEEKRYYDRAKSDRSSLPYHFLNTYIKSSFGQDRFKDCSVLDIGSGEGLYSAYLADAGKARLVISLDLIPHRMRSQYLTSLNNLHFVCGDLFNMPFRRDSFDIVFMNLVLHHLRLNLCEALSSMRDMIRDGGKLVAIEPNFYNPAVLLQHWWRKHSKNEGFLGPIRVKRVLESLDFTNISVGYFWKGRSWARNSLLGSCFFIEATKSIY